MITAYTASVVVKNYVDHLFWSKLMFTNEVCLWILGKGGFWATLKNIVPQQTWCCLTLVGLFPNLPLRKLYKLPSHLKSFKGNHNAFQFLIFKMTLVNEVTDLISLLNSTQSPKVLLTAESSYVVPIYGANAVKQVAGAFHDMVIKDQLCRSVIEFRREYSEYIKV